MTGSCIIDGTDIATLGAFILRGGDYDFLPFPTRKEPTQNNWYERNGIEVDLSEIYFEPKTLSVILYLHADNGDDFEANLTELYSILSLPGYRTLYSREFDRTFVLRFVGITDYQHRGGMYKTGGKGAEVTAGFSMDEPLQLFTQPGILVPRNGRNSQTYVAINGIDLNDFGIIVNECYNTVLRLPIPKQPLTRTFGQRTGALAYFPDKTTFEKKQVIIECTMMADTRDDFYYNYEALFNNLTQLKPVKLTTFADTGADCYYSAMQNFVKHKPFGNGVMVSFDLVLTQIETSPFTYVLGTEDNTAIVANDINLIKINK